MSVSYTKELTSIPISLWDLRIWLNSKFRGRPESDITEKEITYLVDLYVDNLVKRKYIESGFGLILKEDLLKLIEVY